MEEKEEGEISLEDVSSSEDINLNNHRKKKSRSHKNKSSKTKMGDRRVDIPSQDAACGKENRQCSNGFVASDHRIIIKREDSKDGFLPISSDEDTELISMPGSSKQYLIRTGQKKRRKKKKKKTTGARMLTMDDLESDVVVGVRIADDRDIIPPPRIYNAPPVIYNDMRKSTTHQSCFQPSQSSRQRYRSPIKSSYRSPIHHSRSPSPRRRSPRKFLPPAKPSTSSLPPKHCPHKVSPARCYNETYNSSLLKKVKEYDTTAITPARQSRHKECSLKDKLSNMGKLHSDSKGSDNNNRKEINDIKKDIDEEDIDTLRRLALDTKHSKCDDEQQINHDDNSAGSDETPTLSFNSNDHNVEELQLRADALRTAVINKFNLRKKKGLIKKRDKEVKSEVTYDDSLLNDVIDNCEEIYSPAASTAHNGGSDIADMELDSDLEREKINSQPYSPYSPTDVILGDTFVNGHSNDLEDNKNGIIDLETPYSPSDPTDMSAHKFSPINKFNYPTPEMNFTIPVIPDPTKSYLPTSNPTIHNIESSLSSSSVPMINNSITSTTSNDPIKNNISSAFNDSRTVHPNSLISNHSISNNLSVPLEQINSQLPVNLTHSYQVLSPLQSSIIPNTLESIQRPDTVIHLSIRGAKRKDELYDEVIRDLEEDYGPICRDDTSDSNKDTNKMSAHVNKLVPVPILRINKHLQQPLPPKKIDNNPVKVFKSAEMQPVDVNQSVKTNATFKPIKLPQVVKKPLASTSAEAFYSSLNDDTSIELPSEQSNGRTTQSLKISDEPSNDTNADKELETVVDQSKRKPGRPKTPAKKSITTKKTINATYAMTTSTTSISSNKIKSLNDRNFNKKYSKDSDSSKKEQINNIKIIEEPKKSDSITKRVTSSNKLDKKSDENSKDNNVLNKSNEVIKQKKDNSNNKVSKVKNIKKLGTSSTKETGKSLDTDKFLSGKKSNEKKRRSSFEEEELRALALASLPKRLKLSESSSSNNKESDSTKDLSKDKLISEKINETIVKVSTTNNLPATNTIQNREKQISSKINVPSDKILNEPVPASKRPSTTNIQAPLKKIIKKSIQPTDKSTAESIQSTIDSVIQNKIVHNQKKIASLLQQSNIFKNNAKINDPVELPTSKITSSKKIQRMVINLGEDSDTDTDSETTSTTTSKPSNFKTPTAKPTKPLSIPTTEFEKSLEEFLRSQREKTEATASKSSNSTSNKTSDLNKTPQAMRHLPPNKQEEYRRLKQRVAELEKTKNLTNEKRSQNVEKSAPVVKPTESICSTKNQPKKALKTSVSQKTSTTVIASTSTTKLSTSVTNNNLSSNSSDSSSKNEENRLKIIANCTQELLKNIPRASSKIHSLFKANDDVNDATVDNLTDQTIAQTLDVKPNTAELTSSITETVTSAADNDSFEYINHLNDPMSESFTFEEQKVDPNIIASVSETAVVPSNVINWPTMITENSSVNNTLENLVIQISNTRDVGLPQRRQVSIIKKDKDQSEEVNSPKTTAPFLRILTADQLNMRANNVQETDQKQENPILNNNNNNNNRIHISEPQIIDNNNTNVFMNRGNNNLIDNITIEETKIDINIEAEERFISTNESNENSESSSIIAPKNESVNSDTSSLLESTIRLDNLQLENLEATEASSLNENHNRILTVQELSEKINAEVIAEVEQYKNLPSEQQRIKFTTMEQELSEKRQMRLDAYNRLAGGLQELEVEREVQSQLSAEVKRLRSELKLAEERLKTQQDKVSSITSEVLSNQNTVNNRRLECIKHTRICTEMGLFIIGKEYKVPPAGSQSSLEAVKEVASRIKKLAKKKVSTGDNDSYQQSTDNTSETSSIDSSNNDRSDAQIQLDQTNIITNEQNSTDNTKSTEESTLIKIENLDSQELLEPLPVNSDTSQNLVINQEDSTTVSAVNTDYQTSINDSVTIKTEDPTDEKLETASSKSASSSKSVKNKSKKKKNNNTYDSNINYEETPIKQEIIDIELESLPVDSESNISYPNLENELNQIEMNFIAKNEVDKELDDYNELESRLTPIDPTLPEESCPNEPTTTKLIQENINSIQPKTEEKTDPSIDTTLPVFCNTPVQTSSLIRPAVHTAQFSASLSNTMEFDETKPEVNIESSSKTRVNYLPDRRKDNDKNKPTQPVQSYESILPAFNPTRNLDPNAVLCPYELKGTCKDDACIYAHLNRRPTS
ncbi:probable serine/threonine-protein kinase DDB_G0282963 isoform X2 [Microplitis demolitor]|uniref:probable serine/threonine-protein kinase DDB_G0282963 isoform X2 n=1 Tax=Microplitis demolitor TaxID=69319 RepID=UPI00235B6CDB|nr:probable serine/threonine-protein kinase DDB_G0282963 isoform X2 [Microplitis demolitor]